ncbi:MAG: sugar phosphate isomerase/epimerase [Planctomycetia bacterium]|nr:sugar phosphate isomerase/epimerase [Planctomycetia bacterium]
MRLVTTLFLALVLSTASAFAQTEGNGVGTNDVFKGPVGLALYSLRDNFSKDIPATLDQTKDYGFVYVELHGGLMNAMSAEDLVAALKDRGLIAMGGHWDYGKFASAPEEVARQAKALGLPAAGCAWIGHKAPFDEAQCRQAAEVFNKAGKVLAEQGIKFYYHNHGYEFQPYKDGTLFDLLVELTDPQYVTFQLDVMWTVFPGQDPAALLRKYPGRFEYVHLKDLKKGVEGNLSGGTDVKNDVALGAGQTDYPALLKAAQETGVKYYFIEDESPIASEQIKESLKYLESVQW